MAFYISSIPDSIQYTDWRCWTWYSTSFDIKVRNENEKNQKIEIKETYCEIQNMGKKAFKVANQQTWIQNEKKALQECRV